MKLHKILIVLALLPLATATSRGAGLDILITIDESDPSNVIFTATSANPIASDSANTFGDGLDFTQFLTSPMMGDVVINSTSLTTGFDGTPTYDSGGTDNLSGSSVDFNPYNLEDYNSGQASEPATSGSIIENFSTGTQAFTGTMSANFSNYLAELPGLGATGDIYAGYSANEPTGEYPDGTPVLIGEWEVTAAPIPVPEPGQWGWLMFLGAAVLFGARRLRAA